MRLCHVTSYRRHIFPQLVEDLGWTWGSSHSFFVIDFAVGVPCRMGCQQQTSFRRAVACKSGCLLRLAKCRWYATTGGALVLRLVLLACSANGQTPATGTATFALPPNWPQPPNYGYWVIKVNGFVSTLPNFVNGNTFSSLAADMAGLITFGCNASFCAGQPNNGQNPYVTATAVGNVLHLTTRTTGSATNYSFSAFFSEYYEVDGSQQDPVYLPTSGSTLTGGTDASVQGYINPKYLIVGVTYAPPGSQSSVTYTNNTLVGTSTTINNSFTDTTMLTVQIGASVDAFGNGGKITGTSSTSYAQMQGSSNAVTITQSTQISDKTPGPSNSLAGLNHDFDVIWLWLNPVLPLTVTETIPPTIMWNGYGYDPNDQPDLEILPISVGWLNGDIPMPANIAGRLARSWAAGYTWGPGQGPGLTGPGPGTDFATIVQADPFWECTQTPSNCPPTVDPTRFTISDNQSAVYEQAAVGGQPVTETYTLQYTNTSKQGQTTGTTFTQAFGLDVLLKGGFIASLSTDIKLMNTLKWTTSVNNEVTNTTMSTALASITGPTCNVSTGGNSCNPQYSGPVEFEIYQDNQYGTFMFFPVSGGSGAPLSLPTSTTIPSAVGGLPYGPEVLTATGGSGTGYTWCVQSGPQCVQSGPPMPPSFSLGSKSNCGNACTEVALSSTGSPAAPVGSYPFTVQVTDSVGNIATQPLTVTITQGPTNVTGQVTITSSGLAYSRVSQTFNGIVTLKNIGATRISGPLQVLFVGMPVNVSLVNATGNVSTAPYITIPAAGGPRTRASRSR
jgi:hypothetical protein